jgi:tripartite-type tricarboxylate transporter receptor subunit TctC
MTRLGLARCCLALAAGMSVLTGIQNDAEAQSVADFYKGKTITVTVGSGTGGGYDMHARLLARHLGRFIPGNPSLIVQNMPGGQGFTNANWLYNIVPKDGTVMGMLQKLILTAPYLKPSVVKYDGPKFNWIGSATGERSVSFLWHTAPQKTVEDVRREETIVGGSGDSAILAKVYNQVIGTKFKVIRGYPGTNEVIIAMQRGEVQGVGSFSWSNIPARYPDWIREKKINVLFQGGKTPARELPDVPLMIDLVTSEENRKILDLWTAPEDVARPFAMPPGVPADRVAAVRTAFMAMADDAGYLGDARKQGLEIDAQPGEEIDKLYDKLTTFPAHVIEAARAFEE